MAIYEQAPSEALSTVDLAGLNELRDTYARQALAVIDQMRLTEHSERLASQPDTWLATRRQGQVVTIDIRTTPFTFKPDFIGSQDSNQQRVIMGTRRVEHRQAKGLFGFEPSGVLQNGFVYFKPYTGTSSDELFDTYTPMTFISLVNYPADDTHARAAASDMTEFAGYVQAARRAIGINTDQAFN